MKQQENFKENVWNNTENNIVNLKVPGEKQKTHWRLRTNKFPVGLMQEFYITPMQ